MTPTLVPDDKAVLADRTYLGEKLLFAERRSAELADEFTRLEVQISAILIGFLGFFANNVSHATVLINTSKSIYTISIISLVVSLIAGLLHIKCKEIWWDDCHVERVGMIEIWNEVVEGKRTLNDARVAIGSIRSIRKKIIRSPMWTWILQTFFLGLGVILLIVLFLMLVFLSN